MENVEHKKIIWIDEDLNNEQKQYTYYEFVLQLQDYDLIRVDSVKEAFDIISDPNNYEQYKFKLFYVIISGNLADEFFTEYVKKSLKLHILAATIIYCSEECRKKNELKPFYLDTYLNPGKVTDNSFFVINYIKSVECSYFLEEPKILKNEEENIRDPEFAAEFTLINSIGEISFPILISKHINSTLIDREELEKMQKEFMSLYPHLKHLFKPSQEKNIFIPYHILAKYYLYIYTKNTNFFCDMNKDLKNRNFDKYRIYIYLMYNALYKNIFKSYSKSDLFRGGTLSEEEYNNLMKNFKNRNSKNEKVFFFSRKFLSFSKDKGAADYYLQVAIVCQYKGIYVRFIVEGIKDQDYFVTNIDLNEMKLSDFNKEEEVLFLPLSCFEVIDIQNEIFYEKEIKVIKLRYLNQYKQEINKKCEELGKNKNGEELKSFIKNAVNSKYAEELCRYLGHEDELQKKFLEDFSKRTNVDLKIQPGTRFQFKNSNPNAKKYSAQKIFHGNSDKFLSEMIDEHVEWLATKISYVQFGTYNGKPCMVGFDSNGNQTYYDDFNCNEHTCPNDRLRILKEDIDQNKLDLNPEKLKYENINCADLRKGVYKCKNHCGTIKEEGIDKEQLAKTIEKKDNIKGTKENGAVEGAMIGNALGHFLANFDFDEFKKADFKGKLKIIGHSSVPIGYLLGKKLIEITPIIKDTDFGSYFKKGFFAISIVEMCRCFSDYIFSESLTIKEKAKMIGKKGLGFGIDIFFGYLGTELGVKIAAALVVPTGPGSFIISLLVGCGIGFISAKITNKITKDEKLIFYSDSLYYHYIPKKYREYAIPTLKWKNVPAKAKSYAIELIVNENGSDPSWLVINIPPLAREFNEESKEGDLIINYKGIPENAFCGCFILYVFDIKNIDIKDFLNMKNGLVSGKKLSRHLIDYKILSFT